jgi:hypothetical protein
MEEQLVVKCIPVYLLRLEPHTVQETDQQLLIFPIIVGHFFVDVGQIFL